MKLYVMTYSPLGLGLINASASPDTSGYDRVIDPRAESSTGRKESAELPARLNTETRQLGEDCSDPRGRENAQPGRRVSSSSDGFPAPRQMDRLERRDATMQNIQ